MVAVKSLRLGLVAIGIGAATVVSQPVMADSWSQFGAPLAGQSVRAVAVDPSDPLRMAAITNYLLYTSATGGATWESEDLRAGLTGVAYDPARPGRLIVATYGQCIMSRDTPVSTWQSYSAGVPNCNVSGMVVTSEATYFINSGSSVSSVWRLDRNGSLVPTSYGDRPRPFSITADPDGRHLYVASDLDIYRSDDGGLTWSTLTKPEGQHRCCISGLYAVGETIWQLAYGRPYVSYDAGRTWQGRGTQADYHYAQLTLGVHGDTPYFGMQDENGNFPDIVANATMPINGLGLGRLPTSIALAGNHLIVATHDGLWSDQTLLPSAAKLKRPVVVVPGIMGSWPKQFGLSGELVLDPLNHTYDRLVDRLRAVGFTEASHRLSLFPYQWRQDNDTTAHQLAATIEAAKHDCNCAKVDLVAHSMGGLVARAYIQSDWYHGDVGKLIEIATPNKGSLAAYSLWEGGEFYNNNGLVGRIQMQLVKTLITIEAAMKHYVSFIDYVRLRIPSVGQLLPDYSYINQRTYPSGYPRNQFLEELNGPEATKRLHQRVQLYVIGSKAVSTLTELRVGAPTGNHAWTDGSIQGSGSGEGDGTVPLASLNGLGRISWLTNADHGELASESATAVIKYLLDDDPDAAYLAQVPHQSELQALAERPIEPPPQSRVIVYAPESAHLTVKDSTGHRADETTQTIPMAYWFSDGETRYLVVDVPAGESPSKMLTAVTTSEPVPVGVIVLTDGKPDQSSETMIGGPGESSKAMISINQKSPRSITPSITPSITKIAKLALAPITAIAPVGAGAGASAGAVLGSAASKQVARGDSNSVGVSREGQRRSIVPIILLSGIALGWVVIVMWLLRRRRRQS